MTEKVVYLTAYDCPLPPLTARPEPTRKTAYWSRRLVALTLLRDVFNPGDARVAQRRPRGPSLESRRSVKVAHRSVGAVTGSLWFRRAYASAPDWRLPDGVAYGSAAVRRVVTLRAPTRSARNTSSDRRAVKTSRGSGISTSASILRTGRWPGAGKVDSEGTSTRLCCGVSSS